VNAERLLVRFFSLKSLFPGQHIRFDWMVGDANVCVPSCLGNKCVELFLCNK
jgi:hypothetical protein